MKFARVPVWRRKIARRLVRGRHIIGIIGHLVGRRAGEGRAAPARTVAVERISDHAKPALQFVINPPEQFLALELIGRETERRQNSHKDEAIPNLQTPFDGFKNLHLKICGREKCVRRDACAPLSVMQPDVLRIL